MVKTVKHICCVDSVNEGIVRLLMGTDGESAFFFFFLLFQSGIKEGVWLDITISVNGNATKKGKKDVEDLYRELSENS
jgi:hypothetical protein